MLNGTQTLPSEILNLLEKGLRLFPVIENGKVAAVKGWPEKATNSASKVESYLSKHPKTNWGVFADNLLIVDLDTKHGVDGINNWASLVDGRELPETFCVKTPTGGQHHYFSSEKPVKSSASELAEGVDIRSGNAYVVAPSSFVDGHYTISKDLPIADAPAWLVDLCSKKDTKPVSEKSTNFVDIEGARARAIQYTKSIPAKTEGSRNVAGYALACKLKDFGNDKDAVLEVMSEHWACDPRLDDDELRQIVNSAFTYSRNDTPTEASPAYGFSVLNENYAVVSVKGKVMILRETPESLDKGEHYELMTPQSLETWLANKKVVSAGGGTSLADAWLSWSGRREYDRIAFCPGKIDNGRTYNVWKGFAVSPVDGEANHPSLSAWLEHIRMNICEADEKLAGWLLAWFAAIVQKPADKALTSIVFRGAKGSGKTSIVDAFGRLFGPHYKLFSDARSILGNFNSHLENTIFCVLDEAVWAGDKPAEGALKNLITGDKYNIEKKGFDIYEATNYTRVAFCSNEEWVVPTTEDERRFAVFDVGDGRKQDTSFFSSMKKGFDNDGLPHLLKYLQGVDLTPYNLDSPPKNQALARQRAAGAGELEQWWGDVLSGGVFPGGWPDRITVSAVCQSLSSYQNIKRITRRVPSDMKIRDFLKHILPKFDIEKEEGTDILILPNRESCIEFFNSKMGGHII